MYSLEGVSSVFTSLLLMKSLKKKKKKKRLPFPICNVFLVSKGKLL